MSNDSIKLRYKFIVDGEWRFSPEDPSIPDANGNINNYIDTTNFHPMIDTSQKYIFSN
jgi:Glycogen recognition site of AMP-activated protein kinase